MRGGRDGAVPAWPRIERVNAITCRHEAEGMERRRPPGTAEGWYALHDFRRIDWDAWRDAPARERERAVGEGVEYLRAHEAVADADEGASAVFSVVGHDADLFVLHLRPTLEQLDRAQRRFEATALAGFTGRARSFVSVTEVSGYMHEDLLDGLEDVEDQGMGNYMQQRIYPEIPAADHVCFYPMDKRRGETDNWYDLPFEERAEHMETHGEVGREYAARVRQIITGSIGLDDHEWGVTLFADDPTDIKQLLYEMRFDPSSSRYAEFGSFYVGRRFPPSDLSALLAGEAVPTDGDRPDGAVEAAGHADARTGVANGSGQATAPAPETATAGHGSADGSGGSDDGGAEGGDGSDPDDASGGDGRPDAEPAHEAVDAEAFARRAGTYGVDAAGDAVGYGLLFESEADAGAVAEEVEGLRANFDHYDTHVETVVRSDDATTVVGSLWANERAANTASGFLADLPGVTHGVGADLTDHAGDTAADDGAGHAEPSGPDEIPHEGIEPREFQRMVHRFGVNPDDHPAAGYALLFRSNTVAEDLVDEVDDLRGSFEGYDTHVLTTVRADSGDTAVISLWATEDAADTASGFLADLSGAGPGVGAAFDAADEGADDTDDGDATGEAAGTDADIREALADLDVYAGQPHGESVYALVLYSGADPDALHAALAELRERFEDHDGHVSSAVYADADDGDRSAVVSIWEAQRAADEAAESLADLPGIVGRAGDEDSGFGTMGMFYTVKPDYREEFVETFAEVGELLADMDGHLDTRLMVNHEDENDMFIASQWREKEDAMAFFRSDAFGDTVEWGREVLDDRPRHVFLA
jgi:chlorite dismutase